MNATEKTFAPFSFYIKPENLQAYSQIIDLNAFEWTRELLHPMIEYQESIDIDFDGTSITAQVHNGSHLFDRTSDYATIADLWVCSIVASVLEEDCSRDLSCTTADLLVDERWECDWEDDDDSLQYSFHSGGSPERVQLWASRKMVEPIEVCHSLEDFGGLEEFHKFVLKYA
jgi:hypothetical protein